MKSLAQSQEAHQADLELEPRISAHRPISYIAYVVSSLLSHKQVRASLVAQLLRICLPM